MKRTKPLWVSFIALLLLSTTLSGKAATLAKIYLDPAEIIGINPPTTFKVNITANVQNLYEWESTASFTPSLLQVLTVTEGDFLKTVGSTWFDYKTDNINGYVVVGGMLLWPFPPNGASGAAGVLATIEFQVIGSGLCLLDLHDTELSTITGGQQYPILHVAKGGLFDNRLEKLPPHAIFTVEHPDMIIPVVGQLITFNGSASNDKDDGGWIVSYTWDFGDGTLPVTETDPITTHVYALVGTYTVSLTVIDNDGLTDTATDTIKVVEWMEGGAFPDVLKARPEREPWNEVSHGRVIKLFALVGNPTDKTYEVYAKFTVYSTEGAAKLGTITTEPVFLEGHETLELSANMSLSDTQWRVGPNRGPYWALKNLVQPGYTVFAKCYHKSSDAKNFKEGIVAKDFSFKVRGAKHDIAILNLTTEATVPQGEPLKINVTIANEGGGHFVEPFTITVTYKGLTTSGTVEVRSTELKGLEIRTETFTLDTTNLPKGRYLITATLSILTFEMDTVDNVGNCLAEII